TSRQAGWIVGAEGHGLPRRRAAGQDLRIKSLDGDNPSLCLYDVSQDEFRELDDKLAQPGILFKQRHDIFVGVLVVSVVVTSKRRSIEASLRAMCRMYGSHGSSPYSGSRTRASRHL